MSEEIICNYILILLDYKATLLNCVNLGYSSNDLINAEKDILNESKKYIKNIMKERKIKKWI